MVRRSGSWRATRAGRGVTTCWLTTATQFSRTAKTGTPLWRRRWSDSSVNTHEAIDATVGLYLSELRTRIGYAHQIKMRDHHARHAAYRLVFCTNSPHGVELVSDTAGLRRGGVARREQIIHELAPKLFQGSPLG